MEDASGMIRIVLLIVMDTEEMRISESIWVTHGLSSLPPPPTAALQSEQEESVLGSTPAHPHTTETQWCPFLRDLHICLVLPSS